MVPQAMLGDVLASIHDRLNADLTLAHLVGAEQQVLPGLLAAVMDAQSACVDGKLRHMRDTLRAANDGPLLHITFQPIVDASSGKLGAACGALRGARSVMARRWWSALAAGKSRWGIVVAACSDVR
jgi:hypothetical protein